MGDDAIPDAIEGFEKLKAYGPEVGAGGLDQQLGKTYNTALRQFASGILSPSCHPVQTSGVPVVSEIAGCAGWRRRAHFWHSTAMITYRNRKAYQLENSKLRVTVLKEGGHIAELFHNATGVNPLWTPPWPSMEPSAWVRGKFPEYGDNSESKLLAGLMGHNLCMDLFGGPSEKEAAAGITVHGEASVADYTFEQAGNGLQQSATFPEARLRFRRLLTLRDEVLDIEEEVENLSSLDRPLAWTQHVTLGPPFVEPGVTEFRTSATRSKVIETDFTGARGYMVTGAEFDWPNVPARGGGTIDMRRFIDRKVSAAFSTHLMNPAKDKAFFIAWSPRSKLLTGYVWKRSDFPWLGIWEENRCRTAPPWNGETITRGMEFGVSPMPESRMQMVERGRLFGQPGYRWLKAREVARVKYMAFATEANAIPEEPAVV